ncbi:MAG: NAD-dependent deacylase [Desulfurococcales archaeon]|nr:NAD-dependent deacylase [Desulfurococcales archaeon]
MTPRDIAEAGRLVRESRYLIAFTGAGISAESGIPVFRGPGGLWRKYRPEDLATPEAFKRNPRLVWEWYRWRMELVFSAKPNPAHKLLARLEEKGILKAVITQNVDCLHRIAGNRRVIELHGSLRRVKCTRCAYKAEIRAPPKEDLPRCPICGSLLRPDVVWFGEPLPEGELREAFLEASKADVVLVIGTSGAVDPAGLIPLYAKKQGAKLINVNPEPNRYTGIADVEARMGAVEFAKKIAIVLGIGEASLG